MQKYEGGAEMKRAYLANKQMGFFKRKDNYKSELNKDDFEPLHIIPIQNRLARF